MAMQLLLNQLYCPQCRGYAHPFLDVCPGCGVPRPSRYAEAIRDSAGAPCLTDDPTFDRTAGETWTKVALSAAQFGRLHAMGSEGGSVVDDGDGQNRVHTLNDLADQVACQLTYRAVGLGEAVPFDIDLRVHRGAITLQDRKGQERTVIDPALVLAVVPIRAGASHRPSGLAAEEPPPAAPVLGSHRVLVRWRVPDGHKQIAMGNRSGFFTTQGRLAHYFDLTWWIGAVAAAGAQARWRTIGAEAHAVELGLRPVVAAARAAGLGLAYTKSRVERAGRSIHDRLQELDSLRAAGLVTLPEYDNKRREILADL